MPSFFTYFIALTRITRKMLNRNVENRDTHFVPNLRKKTLGLLPVSMRLAVDFSYVHLIRLRKFSYF